jgi:hypothetical protein
MDGQRAQDLAAYYDATDTADEMTDASWDESAAEDPMITTSLRLPKSVLDQVRALAAAEGVKPTALIRRWIELRTAAGSLPATTRDLRPILEILGRLQTAVDEVAQNTKRPAA